MIKLTHKKIEWIIKEKGKGSGTTEIAEIMKITSRYVNIIYHRYKGEG
jgi:hypothetical protein